MRQERAMGAKLEAEASEAPAASDNLCGDRLGRAGPTAWSAPHHLRRIDPARNMARWYSLTLELTLFREWSCTRAFGRLGAGQGRIMLGLFDSRAEAEASLAALLDAKRRRGYRDVA